jgi:predicted Fe-Mo cluster-binding NifX family protein
LVFCPESKEYSLFENPFREEHENEIHLVRFLKELGITSIITGTVGPQVFKLLKEEFISLVVMHQEKLLVFEIMEKIIP